MNKHHQEVIEKFREAALDMNLWDTCRMCIAELLPEIKEADVAVIIQKRMKRFLNDFSQSVDVSKAVETLEEDCSSFDVLTKQAQFIYSLLKDREPSPGLPNYRNVLKKLAGMKAARSPENVETIVDIFSGMVVAIMDYHRGSKNPEMWKKWLYFKTKEDFIEGTKYFSSDLESKELIKLLWLELAADMEIALSNYDELNRL